MPQKTSLTSFSSHWEQCWEHSGNSVTTYWIIQLMFFKSVYKMWNTYLFLCGGFTGGRWDSFTESFRHQVTWIHERSFRKTMFVSAGESLLRGTVAPSKCKGFSIPTRGRPRYNPSARGIAFNGSRHTSVKLCQKCLVRVSHKKSDVHLHSCL